jgi:dienelactone hydrolase
MSEVATVTLGDQSFPMRQSDWRRDWAGSSVDPIVTPVGEPVRVVDMSGASVQANGEAQDVGQHYPAPAPLPRLMPVDRESTRRIESDGTSFGVFSSAREGWKSLSFDLPAGALAGCTGLRFSVSSDEPYDGLVVRIAEGPDADGTSGSVYSASFDLMGDGAWHEITLPFFGDGFRTGAYQPMRQLDADRARQISFVLPYHRPLSFAITSIYGLRAPLGDVSCPTIYPMVEVCELQVDFRGQRRQRSDLPELASYEDLAMRMQRTNGQRESVGEALGLGRAARAALQAFAADFARTHSNSHGAYSYARALGAIGHALWANQVEFDRLVAWPEHADGELLWVTPFVPDQYRDYPVEVASIAYWSEGLRITGTIARPNRPGRYPICLVNHGYGSFSKDHMIQVMRTASAGFAVLASDYRGQGESEGRQTRDVGGQAAMARDVVNGARAISGMPFVDPARVGMWGHSMGGGVSWYVLGSEFGKQIKAYAQVSSGEPRVSDDSLRGLDCHVRLTAGGNEERALAAMPGLEQAMRRIGLPFESQIFPGYSHHGMKYQASLSEALAFLRRHV